MSDCTNCGNRIPLWASEVQLCDECYSKSDPIPLVGETIRLIWDYDFDQLVTRVYDRPYRLQQHEPEMMSQDQIKRFEVKTKEEYERNWNLDNVRENIEEWRNKPLPTTEMVPGVSGGRVVQVERPRDPMDDLAIELWWLRENYPEFDSLICDLAMRGLIAPGQYAIHVWW